MQDRLNHRLQSCVEERAKLMAPDFGIVFYRNRRKFPHGLEALGWQHFSGNTLLDRRIQINEQQAKDPTSNYGVQSLKYEKGLQGKAPLDLDIANLRERIERETGEALPRSFNVRRGNHEHLYFAKTGEEQDVTFDLEDQELKDEDGGALHLGEWRGDYNHQTAGPGNQHPSGDYYEVADLGSDNTTLPIYTPMPARLWDWCQKYRKVEADPETLTADDEPPRQRHPDLDVYDFVETHCGLQIHEYPQKERGRVFQFEHLSAYRQTA